MLILHDQVLYIMEVAEGTDMANWASKIVPPPEISAVKDPEEKKRLRREFFRKREELIRPIMFKMVNALVFLHANNVIHRDFKDYNVVVSQETLVAKLVDFGVAGFFRHDQKDQVDCK